MPSSLHSHLILCSCLTGFLQLHRETDRSWDLCTGKSLVLMAVALGSLEGSMGQSDAPTAIWRRSLVKGLKLRLTKPESSAGVLATFLVSADSNQLSRRLSSLVCAVAASNSVRFVS